MPRRGIPAAAPWISVGRQLRWDGRIRRVLGSEAGSGEVRAHKDARRGGNRGVGPGRSQTGRSGRILPTFTL